MHLLYGLAWGEEGILSIKWGTVILFGMCFGMSSNLSKPLTCGRLITSIKRVFESLCIMHPSRPLEHSVFFKPKLKAHQRENDGVYLKSCHLNASLIFVLITFIFKF